MKKPRSTKRMFLIELVLPKGWNSDDMGKELQYSIKAMMASALCDPVAAATVRVKSSGRVLRGLKSAMKIVAQKKEYFRE